MSSAGKAGNDKGGSDEGGRGGVPSGGKASGGFAGDVAVSGGPPLGGMPPLGGNGGVGGGPIVLPDVPQEGLELWMAADFGVTEQDGAVSAWKDLSAHQRNALQTAVNYRPKLVAEALAGFPGLVFDGVDDHLKLPPLSADFSGGLTIFMVMQQESNGVCDGYFEASNGSEVEEFHLGDWNEALQYEVESSYINQLDYPILLEQPQILAVVHQGTGQVQVRRNSHGVGEAEFALPMAEVTRQQVFIGRTLYDGCQSLSGAVGEIMLYSRAINDQELLDIEAYLKEKWSCCEQ
jgi:hypothetical protein